MHEEELRKYLEELETGCKEGDRKLVQEELERAMCIMQSSEFDYVLANLQKKNLITSQEYGTLKREQMSNRYLILYGIDSRLFAEIWAVEHLKRMDPRFNSEFDRAATKKYEALFEGIKVGIKACRAVKENVQGDRFKGALRYSLKQPFAFRFRNLNVQMCDVFVFIGVWVNLMIYWVLSEREINLNEYLVLDQSKQTMDHMIEINNGNIAAFDKYRVHESDLIATIMKKGGRAF